MTMLGRFEVGVAVGVRRVPKDRRRETSDYRDNLWFSLQVSRSAW